jgi:hypothetical protein
VVINFFNEISKKDVRLLVNDIKLIEGWDKIFIEKDQNHGLVAKHL